jgi:polysaccharide export outer membrane protein
MTLDDEVLPIMLKTSHMRRPVSLPLAFALVALMTANGFAQSGSKPAASGPPGAAASMSTPLPPDYRIGPEDVISVVFWREKDMSADVVVRPDGKISLPLLNDMQAAGYTPDQLRGRLMEAAAKFIEEPNASVVVKTVNSRKVYITGMVTKPGSFPLVTSMNVVQLIAQGGGLQEYADSKNILIVRSEGDKTTSFKFNYKDFLNQKNLQQNIMLRPGDTVVVP